MQGDLLAHVRKLVGQSSKALVAFDPLADWVDLVARDALAEILTSEPSLQDEVGAVANGLAVTFGLKELFTEMSAAKAVDGAHFNKNLFATLVEFREVGVHSY